MPNNSRHPNHGTSNKYIDVSAVYRAKREMERAVWRQQILYRMFLCFYL